MNKKPSTTSGGKNPKTALEEFKELLGPIAAQYSDGELHQLRREMYAMAEILLDFYLEKKCRHLPKRNGGFDSHPSAT